MRSLRTTLKKGYNQIKPLSLIHVSLCVCVYACTFGKNISQCFPKCLSPIGVSYEMRKRLVFGKFKMSRNLDTWVHARTSHTHTHSKTSSSPSLMVQRTASNKMCPPLYTHSSLVQLRLPPLHKIFNALFTWFALTQPIVHATCLFCCSARFIHLS